MEALALVCRFFGPLVVHTLGRNADPSNAMQLTADSEGIGFCEDLQRCFLT